MADPVEPGNPPTGDGHWFESLSPELKVEKSVQSFKDKPIGEVVKSYVEAQKMIGGSIRLPKDDATPEDKEKFYQDIYGKLGRPESPDKYEHKRPTLPDGAPWDEAGEKEFLATAHKLGLNKRQLQGVLDWYGGRITSGLQARGVQIEEAERTLKKEWGGDYERKLVLAQQAAGGVGGEEFVKLLEDHGIANHPITLRTLAAYGETLAEQKIISGDIPGQPTASEAQAKLDAIYANRDHPYFKGDKAAVEEVYRLTHQVLGAKGREVVATMG